MGRNLFYRSDGPQLTHAQGDYNKKYDTDILSTTSK